MLRGVTKEMKHATQETFGPVITIYTYTTLDEAVRAGERHRPTG